jgi:hypothetical protein
MEEANWFKAFINFYLNNLYGAIPLVITINYKSNALAFWALIAQVAIPP